MSPRALAAALLLLWLAAAAGLAATALRPVDTPDWREADLASIARNFSRESMNPLRPRIDWRGDGEGVVEMEPPLLPYAMALLSPVFGEDVRVGRVLALAASLAAFASFLLLARERLAAPGALAAGLAYALNPLHAQVATELRPEPFMLLGSIEAVRRFERWLREGRARDRNVALAAAALAIFAKLPALYLGLLFAALALRSRGARAVCDPALWRFAALALLPALLWYAYARSVWDATGNSLGLSSQDHVLGFGGVSLRPFFGLIATERDWVWMPAGLALAALGALAGAWRRWRELELWWLGALAAYYVATAGTTGAEWARYYHVASLPLAALMLGGAVDALLRPSTLRGVARTLSRTVAALLLLATLWAAGEETAELAWPRLPGNSGPHPLQRCAALFAAKVPPESRVMVAGGRCRDAAGRRVAHNRPYLFYWMDRKGWQPCAEEQSIESVAEHAARGAAFFAAERRDLKQPPGFLDALRARYPLAAECDSALLWDLRPHD
jgi:hypothetical protein